MDKLIFAFLTGLTTGGISCLAVQGGLLASAVAGDGKNKNSKTSEKVALFLVAKLVAYTILGALLGYMGSFLVLSPKVQAYLQILVGIFLIGTAGRLLDLHPFFRYFAVKPPTSIFKLARVKAKDKSKVTPIVVGALTVFLPCGVTQAMMMYALSSSSLLTGALIMASFILGTSPIFFALGTATVSMLKNKNFAYLASAVIAISGILSLNGALGILGSKHTLQNYYKVIVGADAKADNSKDNVAGVSAEGSQEVTIKVLYDGYQSDVRNLKVNVPVKLKLVTNDVLSCARAFTIPSLNISKILPETGEETIEFTPTKTGRLTYSCSMGMYTGYFNVI